MEPSQPSESSQCPMHFSRRSFLGGASVLGGAAMLQPAVALANAPQPESGADCEVGSKAVPFDGKHQAGVQTVPAAHLNVLGLNLRAGVGKKDAKRLLSLWTEDARRLTQGQNPLGSLEPEMVQHPSNLTITCGLGSRFFDIVDKQDQRPAWLKEDLQFSKDQLKPEWGQTDLVLQICCDDPVMLAFATRHMLRSGVDYVQQQWLQQGFLNAPGVKDPKATPRNLFGQKDGTVNPRSEDEFDQQVWIDGEDDAPAWLEGGSCLIVRRIAMNLDTWEQLDRESREIAIGRTLDSGAPLGQKDEFDQADYDKTDEYGLPYIDARSHMALASPPSDKPKEKLLRRAYNYDVPPNTGSEQLSNAGLVFCCYQKDPRKQFIPIQQRLNDGDRLNEWITHTGSAMYAIVPGTQEQGDEPYWAASLLEG
ncbi:Dyp-type peroxidase [Corynebacterium pelargi]|uniref:Dyp-type peroxidase n=1 Tax=Corynebacterium pelargi TaxID=1471400 RepID=UPI001008E18C|nr:Dyp-type peroxidase [Corynebacterium pelargi]